MVRAGVSEADKSLVAELAAIGVSVSLPQLERWRSAGLVERNTRVSAGRGRGSVSHLPDNAVRRTLIVAAHSGQGVDVRLTTAKLFVSFPEFSLDELRVREALAWSVRQTVSDQRVRMVSAVRASYGRGGDDEEAIDAAINALSKPHGAQLGGLDHQGRSDLFVAGAVGPEAAGYERLLELVSTFDQPPGDLQLARVVRSLEAAIVNPPADHPPAPFERDTGDHFRTILEEYEWRDILHARSLIFGFGRRMASFNFFAWMNSPDLPTSFFQDGLIDLNFELRMLSGLFPGRVRTLLRPTLTGGIRSLMMLLSAPDTMLPYLSYFNRKFDMYFADAARIVATAIDAPEHIVDTMRKFPLRSRF